MSATVAVYVVSVWSLLGAVAVSSQSTLTEYETEKHNERHLGAFIADENDDIRSELDQLKTQITLFTEEHGMIDK